MSAAVRVVRHEREIGYTIVAEPTPHWVDFKVYAHACKAEPDAEPEYVCRSESGVSGFTSDIEAAELFLEGNVKWDGCSDWTQPEDSAPWHFCFAEEAADIGKLFAALYDFAAACMPEHCDWR